MPWTGSSPSQTAQRTDGTRSGTDTWQQASAASVKIVSTAHDTHDQDLATMINACLKKDGGNEATQVSMASGSVISWNSGDVTITHAANQINFGGGSNGYVFDNAVAPVANDTAALGSASLGWSDLFLASGAVINWNNGDVTITHASNALTIEGASGGYKFDALVVPSANDGAPLGNASFQWSDLFLAEGGVINWDNGDVTLTQSGNSLTVAGGNLIFPGTATNDSAAAGQVGEFISSTVLEGSAVSLVNNTAKTITSISLTAGDWDVWGTTCYLPNAATTISAFAGGISLTDNTLETRPADGSFYSIAVTYATGQRFDSPTGTRRISVSGTTTVYLVGLCAFATNSQTAFGFLGARRRR